MKQEEIINEIRRELPRLKNEFGVNSIGLFGFFSKHKETDESDLDILVDLQPPYADHYFKLLFFLEKKFDKKVDLLRRGNHLSETFIQHIEKEIVYA